MLLFYNTHPEDFDDGIIPFLCGFLQMSGGVLAEAMNLFMLATRTRVDMCITFFVAFHVLADIDKIYAEAISDLTVLEALEHPLIYTKRPKDIKFRERKLTNKVLHVVYLGLVFFYNSIYYYYLPFIVNFIPYIWPAPILNHD